MPRGRVRELIEQAGAEDKLPLVYAGTLTLIQSVYGHESEQIRMLRNFEPKQDKMGRARMEYGAREGCKGILQNLDAEL